MGLGGLGLVGPLFDPLVEHLGEGSAGGDESGFEGHPRAERNGWTVGAVHGWGGGTDEDLVGGFGGSLGIRRNSKDVSWERAPFALGESIHVKAYGLVRVEV